MFVMILTYHAPLTVIDRHLVEHRTFLEDGYRLGYFVASGPQNPRTGGIIISQLKNREQLEQIMQQDPFAVQGLADYQFIEFDPVKFHPDFAPFVG